MVNERYWTVLVGEFTQRVKRKGGRMLICKRDRRNDGLRGLLARRTRFGGSRLSAAGARQSDCRRVRAFYGSLITTFALMTLFGQANAEGRPVIEAVVDHDSGAVLWSNTNPTAA